MVEIRKPYDPSLPVGLGDFEPTLAQQQFKDQCDINLILKKAQRGEFISHVKSPGRFEDLPDALDYHEAMNILTSASDAFDALPAVVRQEFDNDPSKFLSFVEDPDNVDRMEDLGLLSADAVARRTEERRRADPGDPQDPAHASVAEAEGGGE